MTNIQSSQRPAPPVTQHDASWAVKEWKPQSLKLAAIDVTLEMQKHSCTLVFPGDSYRIAVSFSEIEGHPEAMRVRSTNWRCEDEPNGVFSREDCRAFFRKLRGLGFIIEALEEAAPEAKAEA